MIIALDPGFGNTKVCTNARTGSSAPVVSVLQSAVARPRVIGLAGTGLSASHVMKIETAEGGAYVVGPGAWQYGEPISSLDYSAIASPGRRALFYGALTNLLPAGQYDVDLLVVGLPVPLLQDQEQATAVLGALKEIKGRHEFGPAPYRRGGRTVVDAYQVNIQRIKVLAQPVGAYADWLIDDDLHMRKGGKDAEAAVLDIGMNTLDLYVLRGGEVQPRYIHGAKLGVRRLMASLNGHGQDMEEIDADLRAGRATPERKDLVAWMNEIMAATERAWPTLKRFSAVIPTGGGAMLLADLLPGELMSRGAAVHWPSDPIGANVRGLWKWYARSEK